MAQFLSPIGNDQIIDANGDPLTGGQIETYLAGSTTPTATYTDDTGGTPQSNPIILNSLGYPTLGAVWLTGGISYKFVIKDADGATLRTIDDISGINDASVSQSEWVESGFTPTYISATSFSVPGDQTPLLQINRRLRTTNTSGLVYSSISNSVFAAGITTVTLVNDSTTLDPGLSLVAYGLLSASNPSVPLLQSLKGTLPIANGGTGQTTASAAFDALKQAATESSSGVLEIATEAEAQAGTSDALIVTPLKLKAAQIQLGTPVTLTNQTAVDFTSIPSWVKRITVMFSGVSTNGTSLPIIQLGDSGGIEATGYLGSASLISTGVTSANNNTGFLVVQSIAAATVFHGSVTLYRLNDASTDWVASGVVGNSNAAATQTSAGSKTLSAALDRIRLTMVNGTDQFDAGTVNISYE